MTPASLVCRSGMLMITLVFQNVLFRLSGDYDVVGLQGVVIFEVDDDKHLYVGGGLL